MSKSAGLLIVIDGSDGSGKATQTKLLVDRLQDEGKRVETIDFPQYENNFFGELLGDCQTGEYGDFAKVDPKIASVIYAADRFESSPKIKKWIVEGAIVVADRYVSANQMHQGGKIKDHEKKRDFLLWLDRMEYEIFQIPRPDVVLYLDVPAPTTKKLLEDNKVEMRSKKKYLKRRIDLVELNDEYQENSKKAAAEIVKERNKWRRVECTENGELLSRETIHERVYATIEDLI